MAPAQIRRIWTSLHATASVSLLAAGVALAQSSNNTTDLPDNVYPSWNANPNATAILPIAGFRLDTPYPGTALEASTANPESSWRIQINITEQQYSSYFDAPSTAITTYLIPPAGSGAGSLFDPETGAWDVDEDVASTWRVTVVSLDSDKLPAGAGNNADGSCAGIISDDCMRDMRATIVNDLFVLTGEGYPRGLTSVSSCPFGTASSGVLSLNANFSRTASSLWEGKTKTDKYDSAYNYFGSRPRVEVYIWGHSNTTAVGQPLRDDHVIFVCTRADQAVGGSSLPSAARARFDVGARGTWWAIGAALMAVVLSS
ncbi:uncharacterized protein B0I36DRAFT_432639 [Microdochium trichocladiopsis]|uniref:Uncharacterized protein n=1 Tax=Microdochium trichocladiopsis TaxID=1682393 RepID=A0A9P8Y3Q0_9PEZI|nr:uncharacterized protein B0I36DRAFT_432639 [Microdochium trichocladiopsis]KAH7027357.1 hypothetical protein B0I36DRAFT_432639 [Microdochium trichocladiopsis]